ncbi:hypothetical protein [Bifidobacterium samirii]|uniref:hypothetical protein n=1 Tax=Bifidobacterium samirii TaxID=2306974 RepID=UPI001F49A078|nr:hypothetical protein [Bifidobacterium samirii]
MSTPKKLFAAGLAAAMIFGVAACGSDTASNDAKGHVYFLNGKPEVVDQLQQLADDYTSETGVQVDIQTASSGSYESTLTSELAKSEAPDHVHHRRLRRVRQVPEVPRATAGHRRVQAAQR